jgi:hypothetical protein
VLHQQPESQLQMQHKGRQNNNNQIIRNYIIIIQFNSFFNVLTQQLQEPITESAQEDKYIHSKEINIKMRTKLN